ncbi:MAG: AraC family transcriptional regulator [Parvicellaceae bacterium]
MKLSNNNTNLLSPSDSFLAERRKNPYFGSNWHYHDEFELLYIIKGSGVRVVGDHMSQFAEKQLVLIGSNLPHLFRNEEDDTSEVDYIVIKFLNHLNGISLFQIPELKLINQLLKHSARGILFNLDTQDKVKRKLIRLSKSNGPIKIINLIEILTVLAEQNDFEYLASESFNIGLISKDRERTQIVIDYITQKYDQDIKLEDLASLSNMTTNSFCRFFKENTGNTAFNFLREFRINKACQLLINTDQKISQICYSTGFNSVSTFNRIFKVIKSVSASDFRSQYREYIK